MEREQITAEEIEYLMEHRHLKSDEKKVVEPLPEADATIPEKEPIPTEDKLIDKKE